MVKIKPYNIFNISGQSIISRLIRNGRGEFYSHSGIFESKNFQTSTWTTWEALGSKDRIFAKRTNRTFAYMKDIIEKGDAIAYDFEIHKDNEEIKRARDWLNTHDGDKYDFVGVVILSLKTAIDIIFKTKFSTKYTSKKKLDCSEAVIRFLCYVKKYDEFKVKDLLKVNSLDMCTPQHIDKFYNFYKIGMCSKLK